MLLVKISYLGYIFNFKYLAIHYQLSQSVAVIFSIIYNGSGFSYVIKNVKLNYLNSFLLLK